MSLDYVMVDLDGTLYDTRHRDTVLDTDNPDKWDLFSAQCYGDTVMPGMATLVEVLARDYEICLVTGRSVKFIEETEQRLAEDGIPYDLLKMRSETNRATNGELKAKFVNEILGAGDEVVLAIDDNPSTIEVLESLGIPTVFVRSASRHE